MKNKVETNESSRELKAKARSDVQGAKHRASRMRTGRCVLTRSHRLADEVALQLEAAMQEVVRASVEKAKAGSLQHTKWLCSLVELEQRQSAETECKPASITFSQMLMQELQKKR